MLVMRKKWFQGLVAGTFLVVLFASCKTKPLPPVGIVRFRGDRILVRPAVPLLDDLHRVLGTRIRRRFPEFGNLQVVELPPLMPVQRALELFRASGLVLYAEPDYICHSADLLPNDPKFQDGTLWPLRNVATHNDIRAPQGWAIRNRADATVVAVIDSGIRYTHEDLAANMWVNPSEIPGNGIDDDGNGYVDDVHGINAITGSGDPNDDHWAGHGTAMAGIIGAVGNNGTGTVGVAWGVKLMALKFIDENDNGFVSDAIECISYAIRMGAHVMNNSWRVATPSTALREAVAAARNQGIPFVAAAGNRWDPSDELDNDKAPAFPSSLDVDNVISVVATTRTDALASYSHWGAVSTHLGAPGGDGVGTNMMYTTSNGSDSAYSSEIGTSPAAAVVSGAAALMRAYRPFESYLQLKNRLLASVDTVPDLQGRSQSGGRLNLERALTLGTAQPPNDNLAGAFPIAKPATTHTITFVADNVDATKESREPNHAGNPGGKSVWWKWTAPSVATVTFMTGGSGFDTLLAIYTGSAVTNLVPVASGSDDNSGGCGASRVSFTPLAGRTYFVAVDGRNGASGTVKLTLQDGVAPRLSALLFALDSVRRTNGQFQASVHGPALAAITLDKSTNLLSWSPSYATFTLDAGGSFNYRDAGASGPVGFYRARGTNVSLQESCNAVGYLDRKIPAGASMQANVFNAADNRVSALFASVPTGTQIFKWSEASQSWELNGRDEFTGNWANPGMTFAPGEGLLIRSGGPLVVTFVGEVLQGYNANPVPNRTSVRSSIVPQAGRVTTDLLLPVIQGDRVQRMLGGTNVTYTFTVPGGWSPSEPSIELGESFFSIKAVGFFWSRNFLVWP